MGLPENDAGFTNHTAVDVKSGFRTGDITPQVYRGGKLSDISLRMAGGSNISFVVHPL